MLRRWLAPLLLIGLLGFTVAPASARELRLGSAPQIPGGAQRLGSLAGGTPLSATVALAPRDPAALAAYAAAVSTPGSPDFRHYLSPAGFAQRFGPTAATVAAVRASLGGHGLKLGTLSANGLSLPLAASAATLAQAFSTSFERVALRGGRVAYANQTAPSLDAGIAGRVQSVIGLDNLAHPRPEGRRSHAVAHAASAGATPCSAAVTAARTQRAYSADQIAAAYDFGGLYTLGDGGAGQTVAVYELEANIPSDITTYQSCFGTTGSISYQPVDGGPAGLDVHAGNGQETELDVENVIGLAPLANVIVYQGPNSGQGPYDTYAAIIAQDRAKVITTSWGECEPDLGVGVAGAENTLFQEAAIQGQTMLAAAGDAGAQDCADATTMKPTTVAVDDPASQPYVTGVGGTALLSISPRSEGVWNNRTGAGGGGNSSFWMMPGFQSNAAAAVDVTNGQSSSTACGARGGVICREVPDVSAEADQNTGYLVYYNGSWSAAGGTSGAAPVWAALIALANASSACASAPVGFANPQLYRLAGTEYASVFHDVTSGNNDWTGSNGGLFRALTGYDQASGLGTPNASVLAPALCGQLLQMADPGTQTGLAGRTVSLRLQATDASGLAVTYSATGLPPGLHLGDSTGLISGAPIAAGNYAVKIVAVDGDLATAGTSFNWRLTPASLTLVRPAAQTGRVRHATRLRLIASDNNGAALSFLTGALPRGLRLNPATGVISGTPIRPGLSTVSVTASALGASPVTRSFRWTIAGLPTARARLSGIGAGRPKLSLGLSAGAYARPLRAVTIALPHGLSFTRNAGKLRRGILVAVASGRLVQFSARRVGASLQVTLRSADAHPQLTVAGPALLSTSGLSDRVSRHRSGLLSLGVVATDAARQATRLTLAQRPS